MGYRSDVRSVIYGGEDAMIEFMKENESLLSVVKGAGIVEQALSGDDVVLHLHGESIKWHEDFPEVVAWNKLLDLAEESGLAYELIEIGEDPSDYTQRSAGASRGMIGYVRQTVLNEEF